MYTDPKKRREFKSGENRTGGERSGMKRSGGERIGNHGSRDRNTETRRSDRDKPRDVDSGIRPGVESQVAEEPSTDRLEGRNPVMEALRAGRTINKIWVVKRDESRPDPTLSRIINLAKDKGIIVSEVPRISLDQMSQTGNHQGIIAYTASHEYVEVEDIIAFAAEREEPPFVVLLDELKDAYNLGSILRIADAAGVHGIIIPKHRSISLDSLVAKASAGAIEHVKVARVTNLSQTILRLKEMGLWVAGTDASARTTYDKADFKGPLLVVIGSEGEGMSANIADKCDFLVTIPMNGSVNSLNAAVAAGIVVFEAARQRRKD